MSEFDRCRRDFWRNNHLNDEEKKSSQKQNSQKWLQLVSLKGISMGEILVSTVPSSWASSQPDRAQQEHCKAFAS